MGIIDNTFRDMIQPNELRIGNWVLYGGTPRIIYALTPYLCVLNPECTSLEYLEPIPLTEELIIGLSSNNDKNYKIEFLDQVCIGDMELEYKSYGIWLPTINSGEYAIGKPIRYLHQLQNIFYALTGKELEVKL